MRRDSEQVLRAMQRTVDRQKTLAVYGVLLSDDRLPMTTMDVRDLTAIDGRSWCTVRRKVLGAAT